MVVRVVCCGSDGVRNGEMKCVVVRVISCCGSDGVRNGEMKCFGGVSVPCSTKPLYSSSFFFKNSAVSFLNPQTSSWKGREGKGERGKEKEKEKEKS